jgi:hypothetical protein
MIICRCLNVVVENDSSFRDVYRELGILQTLLQIVLRSYARSHDLPTSETEEPVTTSTSGQDHVNILMIESLAVIVRSHKQNARIVREQGLPCFLQLVWNDTLHSSSLRLIGHISRSGTDEDTEACMAGLCEMLQSDPGDRIHQRLLTADVLATLILMVENSDLAKTAFRLFGGFEIVIDILRRMRGHFEEGVQDSFSDAVDVELDVQCPGSNLERFTEKHAAKLFQEAISLLSVSTVNNASNYKHLWVHIGMPETSKAIACTNIFRSLYCDAALNSLAGLASGAKVFDVLSLPSALFVGDQSDEHLPWIVHDNDTSTYSAGMRRIGKQKWCAEPLLLLISLCWCMCPTKAQRLLSFVSRIASSRPDHAQVPLHSACVCLSVCLSVCPSVCPSVCLSVCLSVPI